MGGKIPSPASEMDISFPIASTLSNLIPDVSVPRTRRQAHYGGARPAPPEYTAPSATMYTAFYGRSRLDMPARRCLGVSARRNKIMMWQTYRSR